MLLAASYALAVIAAADGPRVDTCASPDAPIEQPCHLPTRLSSEAVARLIGARDQIWWMVGDRLTVIARPPEGLRSWLCCSIQTLLEPIAGTDLAGIVVRVPRAHEALLDVAHVPARHFVPPVPVRGAHTPPAPAHASPLMGRIERISLHSAALREQRVLFVYIPPDTGLSGERFPVVYLADGATAQFAPIAEAAARDGRASRIILVGLPSSTDEVTTCRAAQCDRRSLEYLPDLENGEDTHFSRHLNFVTDELIPLIEGRYSVSTRREDRIVAGYSNGGAWALAAAQARPDFFGNVLAMSSGSRAAAEGARRLGGVRVYGGAGLFEPGYLRRTREAVETARRAGADVRFREMVAGHSPAMWEVLFADGIAWLAPPRP